MRDRRRRRKLWSDGEIWRFIAFYPDRGNADLARLFGCTVGAANAMGGVLGLKKDPAYLSSIPHKTGMVEAGAKHRFPRGHVPMNKGLRRPGWFSGRMRETQFKKGQFPFNRDPDFYVLGALRVNADGYIDIRMSFEQGANGWRALHRVLWEDRYGLIPKGCLVAFKDRDRLNVWYDNFELITRQESMRRNSIHNLPQPLRSTINVLGQLKRKIREKQDRGPAQSPVRHA